MAQRYPLTRLCRQWARKGWRRDPTDKGPNRATALIVFLGRRGRAAHGEDGMNRRPGMRRFPAGLREDGIAVAAMTQDLVMGGAP